MNRSNTENPSSCDSMLSTNQKQKEFYESHGDNLNDAETGLGNRVWGWARGRMQSYRREMGIKENIRQFQIDALGDLSRQRVLDLGCFDGNSMSLYLAENSREYLGIDLSETAISKLRKKLENYPNAAAQSVDFLSPDFAPEPFDVVYANGVMHHFEDFSAFLRVLHRHIQTDGYVVSFDPLETSALIRTMRRVYRPFQKDADWEWPFQKSSFDAIEELFEIEAMQGYLGWAKWPIFLTPIPGMTGTSRRLGRAAIDRDHQNATRKGRGLWRCMQVAMRLRKKP